MTWIGLLNPTQRPDTTPIAETRIIERQLKRRGPALSRVGLGIASAPCGGAASTRRGELRREAAQSRQRPLRLRGDELPRFSRLPESLEALRQAVGPPRWLR